MTAARCRDDHRRSAAAPTGLDGLRHQLAAVVGALPAGKGGRTPPTARTARRPRLHDIDPVHRDQAGKFLSKGLDRKFKAMINRFAAVAEAGALGLLWDEAVARGDVPDAYRAVLTHPAVTPALARRVFGEVHMPSHLVGAANRADIRRLQLLEREKDALAAKLERQQRHLAGTLGAKERRIRELEARLAGPGTVAEPDAAGADLAHALRREVARRAQLERRVETLEGRPAATAATERRCPEPDSAEPVPPAAGPPSAERERAGMPGLDGATLLLVGGRPAQVPALARAVAAAGGALLHHDGGTEMSLGQLPGLACRADRIVVALDCVSHAAADTVRRLARDGRKPLLPLPGLSLTSLARALGGATGKRGGTLEAAQRR